MEVQIAEFGVSVENMRRNERMFGQRGVMEVHADTGLGDSVTFVFNDPWNRFANPDLTLDDLVAGDVTVKVFLRTKT